MRAVFSNSTKTNIGLANVDSLGYIDVSWDAWAGVSLYNLYKYIDNDTSTNILVTKTLSNRYIDQNTNTASHFYTYYFLAQDSCGDITGKGRVGNSMRLTGFPDPNLIQNWFGTLISTGRGESKPIMFLGKTRTAVSHLLGVRKTHPIPIFLFCLMPYMANAIK